MKHSSGDNRKELRQSILGFGDRSMKKSYYSQLQKSNEELERYRSLVDVSSEAIGILDISSLRFLDINAGASVIFDMPISSLLRISFYHFLSDEESIIITDWLESSAREFDGEIIIHDGLKKRIITYSLKVGEFKNSKYIIIIARDVTKFHSIQEQLHQSDKLLAIGQLAGGIAHDFNNQLTGIIGFAELIKLDVDNESELHEFVNGILTCTTRATQLTSKLLTFARNKTQKQSQIDVHHIVNEVISLLKHSIDRNITISSKLEAISHTVIGDEGQLQNALLNLGVNARDAMKKGGVLTYSTRTVSLSEEFLEDHIDVDTAGEYLHISVTDTGEGISSDVQKKIFEPFFTTKDEGKGTGLGLAAVYGTVRDHKGFLTLYSEIGIGSTFNIFIPVCCKSARNSGNDLVHKIPKGDGTILIVDDENSIRVMSEVILQRNGYTVLTAQNGEEAVRKFVESKAEIDLVILDMIMPALNGLGALKSIREITSDIPVIISSGYAHNGEIDEALTYSGVSFLQKPFTREGLLTDVANVIHSSK